jgi:hypothetical protein
VKYRDTDYGIEEFGPSKWGWTIYPKKEVGPKVVSIMEHMPYESYALAEAACKAEIDRGLDGKNDASRS